MAARNTSRDIDQAASGWTARLDRGPLTTSENDDFQAWLRSDPRARGALLRAQSLSLMSESAQALGDDFNPAVFEEPKPAVRLSRRRALTWGGGAAAAASLAALGVSLPAGAVTTTKRGEVRLVPLQDGSTVLLNTDSKIRVRYDAQERSVALLRGEAYFSVARDEDRPFVVEVNGRKLRTAQGGFRVRKLDAAPVDILVNQGRLDVSGAIATQPVALQANTRLALTDTPFDGKPPVLLPQPVAPEAVTRDLAWREGKLAFEGETLKQAVAAFARYSDTHIRVLDPALEREPVTGLFAANDPVGFSRAIARVFDAEAEREGTDIVLTRQVTEK
jgi:transmembrane sensor